ncbi:MAG: hypothetical protein JNG89_09445, partial [Planctomycetaceae bacterium]|nr:hypothetical protein [Planctomycetaceae bacterium]
MSLVIGVDEAGYGPNLGPLVITATVWEVPGDPREFDFWRTLRRVLSNKPVRAGRAKVTANGAGEAAVSRRPATRLHVADSKQVYSPNRGLGPLETSVLSLLGCQASPATLADLWRYLCPHVTAAECTEPWFDGEGLSLSLPLAADGGEVAVFVDRLQQQFAEAGVTLGCVASDIVLTERFNGLTETLGGKGAALSRSTLELLRRVWDPDRDGPAVVFADKHGGRSHYQGLLA